MFFEKIAERRNEAKTIRRFVGLTILVLAVVLAAVSLTSYFYIKSSLEPVDPGSKKEIIVDIPIGSSVSYIAQTLEDSGLVKNARVFKYYVKFKNESEFMAGEYHMNPSMTFQEIIESLKTGRIMQEPVFTMTIPEGKQLDEIAAVIADKTKQPEKEVFKSLNDEKFIQSLMEKYPSILTTEVWAKDIKYPLEGYLFPATYAFYKKDPSLDEIVSTMLDKTQSVVEKYRQDIEREDMTVHQFLTMSSLIEEEATEKADRDKIASVFYNRIDEGMPLQTDPTVLYAQGKHKARVTYKDLEVDSPYNTYKNKGLTPGPISNSGTMSMEAALHPADTDFLYFLASSDGTVYFSSTLDEHNSLKAKYITNN
ncbi:MULTISPECIES: endolytic transglycosylase MltG [unclassified Niallia]|uniref:endolytic transglycosylase MltG n=1 Tax=unclassified Niallia TaxID=2837522 RepID=UPI001EDAC24F|nr:MULTISPECIES: endolytic transglycosylase MltG [unclassified Niallia]MDL0437584.1 endolytic transglycosylase MltG [Niallia sp. SS-2023]UPO89604.1 endolytic transglycosylase MltG [Niallia sp. Man26]